MRVAAITDERHVRRRFAALLAAILLLLAWLMVVPVQAQTGVPTPQPCTAEVSADLVPGGFSSELRDWLVTQVDVRTDAVESCQGVTVAAYLLDEDGDELAWGTAVFDEGLAEVEMTEGEAPVGPTVEVRIELPVDADGTDDDPNGTEVDDEGIEEDDDTDVLDTTVVVPTEPPSEQDTQVLGATERLARTGADVLVLVLTGVAAVAAGTLLARRWRNREA